MQLTYHLLSDKGNRRNNEDRVASYQRDGEYCFALADGLGGHEKGEVASKTAVDTCVELFKKTGFDEFLMRDSFEVAQERLLELQEKNMMPDDFKTTLVLLCINEKNINWGHIGDSRLYLFENKKIVLHTLDHSVPQVLVNIGEIEDKDIRNHPDRSHLLSAMGIEWQRPRYEIAEPIEPKPGQAFLMASDGFWELITDEDMVKCLKKADDVHKWMQNMEKIVVTNGEGKNMDNYSAIGIWITK
ncbi:Serine/threonine protein phosphatase PrpC [Lachnospiraceae bacterium RM5]|nr:Serine/threonine protein phosphatase PrpC [Lachnospiraceae bacterium RM5]